MRIRLALSLVSAMSFSLYSAAGAIDSLDATSGTQLRLLELKYFEHTFDDDSDQDRVERLEQLVLGEGGQGSPQARIKKLAEVLQADGESLSPAPVQSDNAIAGSNRESPYRDNKAAVSEKNDQTAATGNYPKVTNLENEILKQTYCSQPLTVRLARLETRAFGSPTESSDLGARTDRLETYAVQVLHNKPFAVNAEIDKPYILAQKPAVSSAQTAQQAIEHFFNAAHRLNDESTQTFSQRTLLGESGLASLGEPPDSSGRQSESARQSQESRQIEEARLSDEAEIYAGSPPPDSAKMLTRVGWCEVQTFGHTFANRHLTARLRQLSKAVLPKIRSDSDLQLMDDLSRIENAVIAGDAGRKPAVAPTK